MTRPPMDENDLARFLEAHGLTEAERGAAVAHLSESDPDAELIADAAYMLRELEADEGVIPLRRPEPRHLHVDDVDKGADTPPAPSRPPSMQRARPRRIPVRWLALAAMLAGVLLVPLALSRTGGRGAGSADFAVLLVNQNAGLPAGWTDQYPWTRTRGGAGAVIEDALAARLGAWNTDLALAIDARQADETEVLAGRIEEALGSPQLGGASLAAAPYREIASGAGGEPATLAPLLAQGRELIASFVAGDAFALGAWAEASRIAVQQRDAAFFRARESRRMLERAAKLGSLDESTRNSIEALRAASRADAEPDWVALESHTEQLLVRLGG